MLIGCYTALKYIHYASILNCQQIHLSTSCRALWILECTWTGVLSSIHTRVLGNFCGILRNTSIHSAFTTALNNDVLYLNMKVVKRQLLPFVLECWPIGFIGQCKKLFNRLGQSVYNVIVLLMVKTAVFTLHWTRISHLFHTNFCRD